MARPYRRRGGFWGGKFIAAEGTALVACDRMTLTLEDCQIDLNKRSVDMLVSEEELSKRRAQWKREIRPHQTPWQQIYRETVGPLATGGCMELATAYQKVWQSKPRNNH